MKVSILLLTIDRYHLTREYVGHALKNTGYPYELCISDNGSTDPEIFKWCEEQHPAIYNKHGYNFGTAQSLNKMIEQNPSDAYVFIGNDIKLPEHWLRKLVEHAENIKEHGVIGIDWRGKTYPERFFDTINGKMKVWETSNTFGTMFVTQQVRNKIGKFCEDYGAYGLWDSDYSIRANQAGLVNFYIPNERSTHFGDDVGKNTEYRKMKDESLRKAKPIFDANHARYKQGDYFI